MAWLRFILFPFLTSHSIWIHLCQESTEDEYEEESEKSKSEVHDDDDDEELEEVNMCEILMLWHIIDMSWRILKHQARLKINKWKMKVP